MKKHMKAFIKSTPPLWFLAKFILRLREKFRVFRYAHLKEEEYPEALTRWYKGATGETLDWGNLVTFNEKMQWLKLYDSTPLKTMLADKYKVRQWVADKIGEEYLIPLLGVWENADDIDFDALPDQFVLKANHGSGWNIIVKDKSKLDIKQARAQLDNWLKLNFDTNFAFFELHYRDIHPVIIAEWYIENVDSDLYDYKILCFDGETKYCWVDTNRHTDHRRSVFDLDFERQPFTISEGYDYPAIDLSFMRPENFDEMIACAKSLCEGFKHVRVDFYNTNGKIYFGEMTFTSAGGTHKITPPEYAKILGDMIKL